MALFRPLSVVERLAGVLKICAGILPVGIEEEIIQAPVEVVMAGNVRLCMPAIVPLVQDPERHSGLIERFDPWQRLKLGEVAGSHFQNVVKGAPADNQTTVRVEFAERKRRIHQQLELRRAVDKPNAKPGARPVPESMCLSVGRLHFEIACAYELPQPRRERYRHTQTPLSSGTVPYPRERNRLPPLNLGRVRPIFQGHRSPFGLATAPGGRLSWFGPNRGTTSGNIFLSPLLR